MASQNPNHPKTTSLYPVVVLSNPEAVPVHNSSSSSSSYSNLYPTIDHARSPSAPPEVTEELLIRIPGAILHLIDRSCSVELAYGDLSIVLLRQGGNVVAVLARVGDEIQWPLAKDEDAVKLEGSHYFFSLRLPKHHGAGSDSSDDGGKREKNKKKKDRKEKDDESGSDILNYGLTIASKGQEGLLKKLDEILQDCSCFSVQKVSEKVNDLDDSVAKEMTPADLKSGEKKGMMEGKEAAYWTTIAPNVEDYSGTAAKLIAAGSGQLVKGILWCGDVTTERLKRGSEVLKERMDPKENAEINPNTLKRIKRYSK